MEKTLIIDGHEVRFKATAATPLYYRMLFPSDSFEDISKLVLIIANSVSGKVDRGDIYSVDFINLWELIVKLAYEMAWEADNEIPDMYTWLEQFSVFSIYQILPDLLELWNINTRQIETPKKKADEQSGN